MFFKHGGLQVRTHGMTAGATIAKPRRRSQKVLTFCAALGWLIAASPIVNAQVTAEGLTGVSAEKSAEQYRDVADVIALFQREE